MRINRAEFVKILAIRDINQKQLAALAGVSKNTVSNIKNGKSCSKYVADRIANALHVELNQLIERSDDLNESEQK